MQNIREDFMNKDFLLTGKLAKTLYKEIKDLPVIDYHNHLSKADIVSNRKFSNITELWITPDPYKHRLMRIKGIDEKYITGDATDFEKFEKWCGVFPELLGTPVYDWCLMELSAIFGIDTFPTAETAKELWEELNAKLVDDSYSALELLKRVGVEYAAPCASITEDVSVYFESDTFAPSLRGDDIVAPDAKFIATLSEAAGKEIGSLSDFYDALKLRLDEFEKAGCVFSDHAIDDSFIYEEDDGNADKYFAKILRGKELDADEAVLLKSEILRFMACEYACRGLVMQLHIGALRKTSSRLRRIAGAAGGFAGIGSDINISELTRFLDDVETAAGYLPKTILFTLNPSYNAALSILSGSYSRDGVGAVVSQGPAWWWCDHITGMREVFESLAVYSALSEFVGMTTDSRSFLSFVRHDYFRRTLCSYLADKVECGDFPERVDDLILIAKKMCYLNAKELIK